jgi:hypothetical protein
MACDITILGFGLPYISLLITRTSSTIVHHSSHQIKRLLVRDILVDVDLLILRLGSSRLVEGHFVLGCGEELREVLLGVEELYRGHLQG